VFSQEPVWISLRELLLRRQEYRSALSRAEKACADRDFGAAKKILEEIRKDAPDGQANRLHEIVCKDLRRLETEERAQREREAARIAAEEKLRREAEELKQSRRNAAEQTRKKREIAIAEGRQRAAALAREGDFLGAIRVLERLGKQYPNSSELRREMEIASRELIYQREAGEREGDPKDSTGKRRVQQFEKIGRETVDLLRKGEFSGAFTILKQVLRTSRK
jgi:DNA-directed RNA polymerase beta subunit